MFESLGLSLSNIILTFPVVALLKVAVAKMLSVCYFNISSDRYSSFSASVLLLKCSSSCSFINRLLTSFVDVVSKYGAEFLGNSFLDFYFA